MASAQGGPPGAPSVPLAPPPLPSGSSGTGEETYGGYTRFELELEFVQSLANPNYLNHLAVQKFLADPRFVAYLAYLRYWTRPPYLKYLDYPGPTLKNLELLQLEKFRQEIISPDRVYWLAEESAKAAIEWKKKDFKKAE
ncbi:SOH1-domain-containing protein [Thozetella sp. PMI_491]|nr:SOH1-domain-containing protein [Thozetella sp. PMI_491]